MSDLAIVLRLRTDLVARIRHFVESEGSGYESLHDFIRLAIENQLDLQAGRRNPAGPPPHEPDALQLLKPPADAPAVAAGVDCVDAPLFHMTNRLVPLKLAVRALANLANDERLSLKQFQRRAAIAARALGQRLRLEDIARSGGVHKRWIGLPVGEDLEVSLSRFVSSFTIWTDGTRSAGPLAVLGLAAVVDDRPVLTQRGWLLASLPSPVLGEAPGSPLSEDEARVLREAIQTAPSEYASVRRFLEIVEFAKGLQKTVDRKLRAEQPDWSENRVVAHRAAIAGRLADVGVLLVGGRGPQAQLKLAQHAGELLQRRRAQG